MSDNPMYWPGHQRPAWHQQQSPATQPVNSTMTHYATHSGNMLATNPMPNSMGAPPPGMVPPPQTQTGDPAQLGAQLQSSIPPPGSRPQGAVGATSSHQQLQHQPQPTQTGSQAAASGLYQNMMTTSGAGPQPRTQPGSNPALPPSHPGLQHPQSHYPHQYSSLATSYWNQPPPPPSSMVAPQSAGPNVGQQQDTSGAYHSNSGISPLSMPNDSRVGSMSNNSSSSMQQQPQQQSASSFHNPKDIQSAPDHMMSPYDRRATISQQHSSQMISQPQQVPTSTATSNLSPTQSQMNMQGRIQSSSSSQQSQLDSMRSMPTQPPPSVSNWSNSYYGQSPGQSPYSSVMNPYMPYGSVSNHNPSAMVPQSPSSRPPTAINQKPSTNGSERARGTYPPPPPHPPHGPASMYGQPGAASGATNGSYYGYDSYYNQANPDPYLTHSTSTQATSQHWATTSNSNQMISNTSAPPPPSSIRSQSGAANTGIHPQSPSSGPTSTSLPSSLSRQTPNSLTPNRSPAPQHGAFYPSPGQQQSAASTTSKSGSNSLAQLEQMVMPGSAPNSNQTSTKSPTQRSTTNSPSTNVAQQQLQYSYNTSGQGSYFSSNSNTSSGPPTQSSYYPQYDPSNVDMQKSTAWTETTSNQHLNSSFPPPPGSIMMEGSSGPSSYGAQGTYDPSNTYGGEYTTLSAPSNSLNSQPRFPTGTAENSEAGQTDKSDPYAIDSQTFDDYDDYSIPAKTKKGRAKKGEEKVKKERKPRAARAPKKDAATAQPIPSPAAPATPAQTSVPQPQPSSPSPQQSTVAETALPEETFVEVQPSQINLESTTDGKGKRIKTRESKVSLTPKSAKSSKKNEDDQSDMENNSSPSPDQVESPSEQLSLPSATITRQPSTCQTPDRSPIAQHGQSQIVTTTSPSKSDPITLAQIEQIPVPTSSHSPAKSPVQRSASTKSPSNINQHQSQQQQPIQYPYNPTGQPGYYSNTTPMPSQSGYYPQYDPSGVEMQKSATWSNDPSTNSHMNSGYNPAQPMMIVGPSPYPATYDGSNPYSDYTALSSTNSIPPMQPRFSTSGDHCEQQSNTPQDNAGVIETEEEPAPAKPKKERKPRAPRAPKAPVTSQSNSPLPNIQPNQTLENNLPQSHITYSNYSQQQANFTPKTQPSEFTISANEQQLAEPKNVDDEFQLTETQDKTTPPPKPKKSRAKKSSSEDKPKRERRQKPKPPAPPVVEQHTSSPLNPPTMETATDDATMEPQASQSSMGETTPAETKPKRIRIRDSNSKSKKKLPKFALKFAKTKKRKRLGSSDNDQSDLEKTPPPSPDEVESGVQKRRSARNTKKLKYNDDIELGFSDSDDSSQVLPKTKKTPSSNIAADTGDSTMILDESVVADEPTVFAAPVEDTMVVEKIMASRMGQRELEPEPGEVLPPDGTHIEVEEFYVKYKNLSYLHCDWRTLEELEKGDRRVAQKVKRYKQKKDNSNLFSFMDEEPFDPQYCEVDRILALNEVEEMVPDSDDDETDKMENHPAQEAIDSQVNTEIDKTNSTEIERIESSVDNADRNETGESESQKTSTPQSAHIKDEEVKLEKPSDETESKQETQVQASISNEPVEVSKPEETQNPDNTTSTKLETIEVEKGDHQSEESGDDKQPDVTIEQPAVEKTRKMKKKVSRHFLVKWKGLSYEESTWELEDDLDPEKIKQFMRFKDPPPKSKWKHVKRPKPEEWVRKETSPVYKNNNTLREYQLEGINWLSFCWHQGRNCILADEMGLGKTIQSIAFVNEIYQHGINGPFLIIVPLSTVGNWAREFETWTDLNVITYHGSSTSREMLKEYEMFYRNEQGNRITSYYKFQVMITTFEIILSDCLDLREIPWRCCIIDEAHRLKNRNCKLLEGLRLLNMEHRVLLTGTPLQNNVEELFSLLNFLEPNQFSSTEQFLQEFGDLKTEAQVDKLKLILKPMMLRRLKEDVEKTLAPKEETIVEVELTNIQKKYYRAILEKNFSFLTKGSSNNNMPNLMNTMMELRKCCIHPYLINGAEEQILYEARQTKLAGGERMSSFQAMVNSSGKLVLIDKLLPRLRADGHRVLIFSQMVRCLDILEDYVTQKHYPFERIDGRVRGSERQQAIDRFSKPGSDRFVFLLCTRAGGLGINLTAADTVIIFDSDWNPQNDLQAQARCHRIGQSKAVKIYRLICRNTYEREMFDKASLKLGLDKAVLQSMNTQKSGSGGIDGQLTKKEIEELLRKGAYGALMDDDNAGDKFCEEDIDQILQRRTQVITIDNSEAKGSTFSKATFSSSNNREDIELDDPNFWEKWAKKANIDSDELLSKDELIQLAPRRRTQTKRYGADGNLIDISDLESSEEDEETISMRTRGSRSGKQTKLTPSSSFKRNKRRMFELDDENFLASLEAGYWSRSDCLKVEKGLLIYGWGRWEEIIASNRYKREMKPEDVEQICRVILLYCLNNYKGDEKIKSFAWELITPLEDSNKEHSDLEANITTRGRKPKAAPLISKKSTAEEISDAEWPKELKNDPQIVLPDDQYRRHLQRNCNRLLIRVKFLHYLKNDILKGYDDRIIADCNINEVDLPAVPVDGELPASWWDDDADKSLLVGIFKHGHDKFNLMRQDPNLSFLHKCGPPNKEDLLAEMNYNERIAEDLDDENRDSTQYLSNLKDVSKFNKSLAKDSIFMKDSDAGEFLDNLVDNVVKDLSSVNILKSDETVDENKNSILKYCDVPDMNETSENGLSETNQTKMDITDDECSTIEAIEGTTKQKKIDVTPPDSLNGFFPFPSANDLNQRFRRLITAYQRNFKKLEIKLAQKARDELKKERTSKYEAAKNEREERKRFLAQKWSRREEADFFRAISSFGVEYDAKLKHHDWNRFRAMGKLEKKLDETMEEYYKAFVIMCKKVTNKPITSDEEKCPINVEPITEERASKCLSRIEFLNKLRNDIITHPELDERLKLCLTQSDLPDWWENGKHDKELLFAAAKHGLTRLDYNIAHDSTLSFDLMIKQKAEHILSQPPSPILIPIEQLEELLERNGIEYVKDLDLKDDQDEIKAVLNSLLDSIEEDASYKSFTELIDGPHSKNPSDSLLAASNTRTPPKLTRSATANSTQRLSQTIQSKRGANTIVRSAESTGSSSCVRLTTIGHTTVNDCKLIEIIPIVPDKIPEDLARSFEAGEISISFQSDAALLQLDSKEPIVLVGATNPVYAKIRWPKDKAIQTRLENLVYLVEKNEWPNPPRPSIPTITLPNHMVANSTSTPLSINTSPSKNDRSELSHGSPKSDISNISSKASKQDLKEQNSEISTPRGKRGRGRRPRQADNLELPSNIDLDSPKEDRHSSKFRNLSSQSSSRGQSSSGSNINNVAAKLTAKFGTSKQGNLSSLLASFKQKSTPGASTSSRTRDNKNMFDLNSSATANLLPQILANMKPEFRDLLSNQDAATMLLNSLSGLTGSGNLGASLLSNPASQMALESLLNVPRSTSSKGPPPAHQTMDNLPAAHSDNSRELRRNSQSNQEKSSPSLNLRSTRGRGASSMTPLERKVSEMSAKNVPINSSSKKRGRPTSSSDSPNGPQGADILDLSSLPLSNKSTSSPRFETRSRRHRDQNDELSTSGSPTRSSSASDPPKDDRLAAAKLRNLLSQGPTSSRGGSSTGSGIDNLAAKLTAKLGVNKQGNLSSLLAASSKEKKPETSSLRTREDKTLPDLNSSATNNLIPQILANMKPEFRDLLSNQDAATMLLNSLGGLTGSSNLGASLLSNPASQLALDSLLNVPRSSSTKGPPPAHQMTDNLPASHNSDNSRELRRNSQTNREKSSPSLNLRSTRGRGSGSMASLETQQKPAEPPVLPKTPSAKKRPAPSNSTSSSDAPVLPGADVLDLSSLQQGTKLLPSLRSAESRSRRNRDQAEDLLATAASSLASAAATKPTSSAPTLSTAPPTLNLANQFPNLNNLGGLLNFPGMSELMKTMSNFPGLGGSLPRIPTTPVVTSTPSLTPNQNANSDKGSRRSRQSTTTSAAPTPTVSNHQQAANAALANSLMNLVSQPSAAANPYSNFTNPFANPLLPFGLGNLGNLGLNNPLGMGLFPNMYMPPGFPAPDTSNQTNNSTDSGPKDKKMRYSKK